MCFTRHENKTVSVAIPGADVLAGLAGGRDSAGVSGLV